MNIVEYADREMLNMQVANVLAGELRKALSLNEFASFVVPGGTTPGPIFDLLSGTELDWNRVHVMLTDERWVGEDNSHSNARLVKERMLTGHAAEAAFLPFYRDGITATEGAAEVADTLTPEFPISVLVLGMGADMHTASLFPGGEGLEAALASGAPALCRVLPKGQDMERVTLSAQILKGAMSTHLVIFGDEKREALERALTLPPEEAPIGAVLGAGTVHWAA